MLAMALIAAGLSPYETAGWTKIVVDTKFRSEAAALADVNRDRQPDVLVGDYWYDGKSLKPTEIRAPKELGDGLATYSDAFAVFVADLNQDRWPDQIVVGYPGEAVYWYENPKGGTAHWAKRLVWPSACNESPLYVDLFRDGRKVLVMGTQPPGQEAAGQMVWVEPASKPGDSWIAHPVSERSRPGSEMPGTQRYAHGLGVGDIDGDGRNDVVTVGGWWQQPREGRKSDRPWQFHKADLGGPSAHLIVQDVDGDRKADVIASSAHAYGIWSAIQESGSFEVEMLFPNLVASAHALVGADIDGDRVPDLVTGKRFWAHGWNDPGARDPSRLFVLFGRRAKDGTTRFHPTVVDEDSGVGTSFEVADFNRDRTPDIVVSNKKGVFVFLQKRG